MVVDESMIVAVAFATMLFLGLRPFIAFLNKNLDARSARIDKELKDATRLREEAQHMMSEYERKCREVEQEAQQMLAQAEHNVVLLKQNAEKQLKDAVAARIAVAHQQIALMEEQIIQEMKTQAIERSVRVTQHVIQSTLTQEAHNHLLRTMLSDASHVAH
ncbi:MAG: hypothetical protein EAZ52_04100 [Alphaproteobacteria bacterium]|nr:MAG: hypothetical protein EAZ52_04100 [Alphaproteobacteria bacterium]